MTQALCYELTLYCPKDMMDYVGELALAWPGVTSVQAFAEPDPKEPERGHPLKVYWDDPSGKGAFTAYLKLDSLLEKIPIDVGDMNVIEEKDWAESWKNFWHETPIGEKFLIRPTWETLSPEYQNRVVIDLDPGSAFGTGAHETTRLMLLGLEKLSNERDFSQLNVLDVGTGSGILAIATAKLGSRDVAAMDIDPLATHVAEENVKINGVNHSVQCSTGELFDRCQTQYDIILANILANVIISILPEIMLRLRPNGTLLASGIVEHQAAEIEAAFAEAGLQNIQRETLAHWVTIRGSKPLHP